MFDRLLRWLRPRTPEPATRLSADQAVEIARRSAEGEPLADHLSRATLDTSAGRPRWIIGSATFGLILEVVIDDETGEVLEVRTVGKR